MNIKVIAQNAIKITTNNGKNIYFDPFKIKEEQLYDADVIFITHPHFDHFSPEDISKIKKDSTKIVITEDIFHKTIECGFDEDNILEVLPNHEYNFAGIKFKTIPSYNINKEFHKKEYNWVGYIVEIDDSVIFVAGDTDITPEALNVKCDIAFVPVGGTYTMTANEAAEMVLHILPKQFAVPTHYKTIVGSQEDAKKFKKLLDGKVKVKFLMD